jgi:hypothetical protein
VLVTRLTICTKKYFNIWWFKSISIAHIYENESLNALQSYHITRICKIVGCILDWLTNLMWELRKLTSAWANRQIDTIKLNRVLIKLWSFSVTACTVQLKLVVVLILTALNIDRPKVVGKQVKKKQNSLFNSNTLSSLFIRNKKLWPIKYFLNKR